MARKNPEDNVQNTKYEIARMLGSRALQLALGAPFLVKIDEEKLKVLKYNPIEIAKIEMAEGLIPIAVKRFRPGEEKAAVDGEAPVVDKAEKVA